MSESKLVKIQLDAAKQEFLAKVSEIGQLEKQLSEYQQDNRELGLSQSNMEVCISMSYFPTKKTIVFHHASLQHQNKVMEQKLCSLNHRHDQAVKEFETLHSTVLKMDQENEQLAEQIKV